MATRFILSVVVPTMMLRPTDRSYFLEMTSEYHLLKEEHMKRMVALRQESEILKQQAEIEKVKKELKELRGEPDTADNAQVRGPDI